MKKGKKISWCFLCFVISFNVVHYKSFGTHQAHNIHIAQHQVQIFW
jgi:hypothetical protein